MPKILKKQKSVTEESILTTMPWTCSNFGSQSEIDVYVESTGTWATIATVNGIENIDAEDMASFIVRLANAYNANRTLFKDTIVSLEACLKCDALTQKTKTGAETAILRLKKAAQ